ncbi:MAG: bifunctional folylpolyglutamate synthase/dihydrofolate synthase [Bacteroidetes bacterium]|nr:bifunctional folylpolyglutamate synthase/dihydrofolate synthase [Bacteroidota bacterium]
MKSVKFTSYKNCLKYLYDLERAGIKYDLRNIRKFLKFLGDPHKEYKTVHVAGTNGKGSVSSIINSVLIENRIRTGLYTSPHILDFRERILVNGKFISRNFIIDFVNRTYALIEKIRPSFFEVTTAMAFEYFKVSGCSMAVIETGLGGRLDSTNVIRPVVSVITGISIDHTEFLGNSISSITREKGGIIKKNIPLVIGKLRPAAERILTRMAAEKNSEVIHSENEIEIRTVEKTESGFYFKMNGNREKYFFPVIGDYQTYNLSTALSCLKILEKNDIINLNTEILMKALADVKINSRYRGRFEVVSDKPKIVTDISHNLEGIKNIESNLKYFRYRKAVIIFGMMNDKNYRDCIKELRRLEHHVIFTKPEYKRAAEPELLYSILGKDKSKFDFRKNVKDAFELAQSITDKNDLILVTGSFFLVSDFLRYLNKLK